MSVRIDQRQFASAAAAAALTTRLSTYSALAAIPSAMNGEHEISPGRARSGGGVGRLLRGDG